jgi:hypothetical protein
MCDLEAISTKIIVKLTIYVGKHYSKPSVKKYIIWLTHIEEKYFFVLKQLASDLIINVQSFFGHLETPRSKGCHVVLHNKA